MKGVSWDYKKERWVVYLDKDGKRKYLGSYKISKDAEYIAENPNEYKSKYKKNKKVSGFPGVRWDEKSKKWMSYIRIKNKGLLYLGSFDLKEEAIRIRKQAEIDNNFVDIDSRIPILNMNLQKDVRYSFDYNEGYLIEKIKRTHSINIGDKVENSLRSGGYIKVGIGKKEYMTHRLIWIWHNGEIPEGMEIDHINHVRDDNRIENLRLVTQEENMRNLSPIANKSKNTLHNIYIKHNKKGVEKYCVRIGSRANHFWKTCYTLKEAILIRDVELKNRGYHENHGKLISELNER